MVAGEKGTRAASLFVALRTEPCCSASEFTIPGDGARIDDRYTSRSYLTGVVHQSDLRTDATIVGTTAATTAAENGSALLFSLSPRDTSNDRPSE